MWPPRQIQQFGANLPNFSGSHTEGFCPPVARLVLAEIRPMHPEISGSVAPREKKIMEPCVSSAQGRIRLSPPLSSDATALLSILTPYLVLSRRIDKRMWFSEGRDSNRHTFCRRHATFVAPLLLRLPEKMLCRFRVCLFVSVEDNTFVPEPQSEKENNFTQGQRTN